MKKNNSGTEGNDLNILSWVLLTYTRVNTMKRRKDVNQGVHLRDFKLCICLNGVGVSSEIIAPASCFCKLQLVCRRLQELTPNVHCMAPADGLYGVQVLVSPLHCMHSLIWVKAFLPTYLPLSEEFGNVVKIGVRNLD